MALIKIPGQPAKDSTGNSVQCYVNRLKKQGFLPNLNGNDLNKLKDRLAKINDNVLPPLPTNGNPRGAWNQLFGQGGWSNSKNASDKDEAIIQQATTSPSFKR